MEKKVIYSVTGLNQWVEVAERLQSTLKWNPVYWITVPQIEEEVIKQFPETVTHSFIDANRCISPQDFEFTNHSELDEETISDYLYCESIALKMMDRYDMFGSYNYGERIRTYYYQLQYWINIIEEYKPDILFLTESPHSVSQFVLYSVARKKGINTLMFIPTSVKDYVYLSSGYDKEPVHLINKYEKEKKSEVLYSSLTEEIQQYISKVKGDYNEAEPWFMKKQKQNVGNKKITKAVRSVKDVMKISFFKKRLESNHYNKAKGRQIEDKLITSGEKVIYKYKSSQFKKQLLEKYNSFVSDVDLNSKFIYFPLHYQPERTTCPEGGFFTNQLLVVKLLSQSIPQGWSIYVKEHSTQFLEKLHGEKGRESSFYDDIMKLENVKLVPLTTNSFELIDNSQAVATVTGTSGWEAILRGKPAINFGYSWYRFCEGVFIVKNKNDCTVAIQKIIDGYLPNEDKVIAFIKSIELNGFKAYLNPSTSSGSTVNYDEYVNNVVSGIEKYLTDNNSQKI